MAFEQEPLKLEDREKLIYGATPKGLTRLTVFLDSSQIIEASKIAASRDQMLTEYLTQVCWERIEADKAVASGSASEFLRLCRTLLAWCR